MHRCGTATPPVEEHGPDHLTRGLTGRLPTRLRAEARAGASQRLKNAARLPAAPAAPGNSRWHCLRTAAPPGGAQGTGRRSSAARHYRDLPNPRSSHRPGPAAASASARSRRQLRPPRRGASRCDRRPRRHAIGSSLPGGAAHWPGGSTAEPAIGGRRC